MKICIACSQELPKEKFSKKQWQLKQQRRCKDCIAVNREMVKLDAPTNDNYKPPSADGEGCASSSWSDEDLFKQPSRDECPICMLTMPLQINFHIYQPCCGKTLCHGCVYGVESARNDNHPICPFCRTPVSYSEGEHTEDEETRGGWRCRCNSQRRMLLCNWEQGFVTRLPESIGALASGRRAWVCCVILQCRYCLLQWGRR